jgi:hypothetical protein
MRQGRVAKGEQRRNNVELRMENGELRIGRKKEKGRKKKEERKGSQISDTG